MSFFGLLSSYDEAWKAIIMPPRQDYSQSDLGQHALFVFLLF